MEQFNIVVTNQILNQLPYEEVKNKLVATLKLSEAKVEKILSTKATTVKKSVDKATAHKYKNIIERCGVACELEAIQQKLELVEKPVVEPQATRAVSPQASEQSDAPYNAPKSILNNDDTVFCRECGTAMNRQDNECGQCGAQQQAGRSKVTAGFLAFFLGSLGAHRFYLGQWWGIFYIPLSLFMISNIISLVEAIVFWCSSDQKWNEKYGHLPSVSGWVVFAICFIPFIAVIGILAVIAVPAYQDYSVRARVFEGLTFSEPVREEVTGFIQRVGFIPNSNIDAGLPENIGNDIVKYISLSDGGDLTVMFEPLDYTDEAYSIIYQPIVDHRDVEWVCIEGSMPNKYRPSQCRNPNE